MSQKRPRSPSPSTQTKTSVKTSTYLSTKIYHSAPIHDRASIFRAVFSPDPKFLTTPRLLRNHPDLVDADHRILAWRRRGGQQRLRFGEARGADGGGSERGICEVGSDDDGERYAGKKVEGVLSRNGVEGVVVVARWYGGVMLGPVRFKWIEDVAGEAIAVWKGIVGAVVPDRTENVGTKVDNGEERAKRIKLDEKETEKLRRVLKDRDVSIGVLRNLLEDKSREEMDLNASTVTGRLVTVNDGNKDGGSEIVEESNDGNGTVEVVQSPSTKATATATATTATTATSTTATTTTPTKLSPNYDVMPLVTLRKLEKARDATIGFLLRQIDAVEGRLMGKKKNAGSDDLSTAVGKGNEVVRKEGQDSG